MKKQLYNEKQINASLNLVIFQFVETSAVIKVMSYRCG